MNTRVVRFKKNLKSWLFFILVGLIYQNMERYSRAYRDQNSPLTPILPMSSANVFNFDSLIDGHNNDLGPTTSRVSKKPKQRQFSKEETGQFNYSVVDCSINDINNNEDNKENRGSKKLSGTTRKNNGMETAKSRVPKITINNSKSGCCFKRCPYDLECGGKRKTSFPFQRNEKQNSPVEPKQHTFLKSSPITPKPLSPRLGAFLAQYGLNRLMHIFQAQEIDYSIFFTLSSDELKTLGITNPEDRERIIKLIETAKAARHFFK